MDWQRTAAVLTAIYLLIEIGSYILRGATLLPDILIQGYNLGATHVPYFEFLLVAGIFFFLGRVSTVITSRTPRLHISRVPGCIKDDGVCWKGKMEYRLNSWSYRFDDTPICPECKTPLQEMTNATPANPSYAGGSLTCPKGHVTVQRPNRDIIKSHRNVLRTHLDRIVSSESDEYSLNALANKFLDKHDNKRPTGEDIWRMYVEEKGDSELSTDCFY